jgi:2-oxopent-4-enoate/cis-2-oxohex-4-enoate hydratase
VTINDGRAGSTGEPWTMGGPAATLRWLAARLAGLGLPLRRGQVILTGSALPLFPVGSGSRVTAEARPLGRSSVTIE